MFINGTGMESMLHIVLVAVVSENVLAIQRSYLFMKSGVFVNKSLTLQPKKNQILVQSMQQVVTLKGFREMWRNCSQILFIRCAQNDVSCTCFSRHVCSLFNLYRWNGLLGASFHWFWKPPSPFFEWPVYYYCMWGCIPIFWMEEIHKLCLFNLITLETL